VPVARASPLVLLRGGKFLDLLKILELFFLRKKCSSFFLVDARALSVCVVFVEYFRLGLWGLISSAQGIHGPLGAFAKN